MHFFLLQSLKRKKNIQYRKAWANKSATSVVDPLIYTVDGIYFELMLAYFSKVKCSQFIQSEGNLSTWNCLGKKIKLVEIAYFFLWFFFELLFLEFVIAKLWRLTFFGEALFLASFIYELPITSIKTRDVRGPWKRDRIVEVEMEMERNPKFNQGKPFTFPHWFFFRRGNIFWISV